LAAARVQTVYRTHLSAHLPRPWRDFEANCQVLARSRQETGLNNFETEAWPRLVGGVAPSAFWTPGPPARAARAARRHGPANSPAEAWPRQFIRGGAAPPRHATRGGAAPPRCVTHGERRRGWADAKCLRAGAIQGPRVWIDCRARRPFRREAHMTLSQSQVRMPLQPRPPSARARGNRSAPSRAFSSRPCPW
jgi:hypothetical protein